MLETRATTAASLLLASMLLAGNVYAAAATGRITEAEAQFHAMAGEMAAGRAMPETAAEEFLKALDYAPNAEMAARATAYALAAKREDLALLGARKWLAADSTALDPREVIASLSLKAGATAEALAQCQAIVQGHPGGEADGYRHVALLLSQDKSSAPAALALMKTLAAQRPQLAGAQRALSLLAFRFDDLPLAEKAARDALRLAPNERESTLLLVGALVRKGDTAGAEATFEALAQAQKDPNDLRLGYARLLIDGEQRVLAKEQLGKVLKTDARNADAHFAYGLLLLDERKWADAEGHFTELLNVPEREADAAYYLGRVAEQRKQYAAALAWYEKVNGGTQTLEAFLHRAQVLAQLGRLPEAREMLATLREQYPPLTARLIATEADLLAQQDDTAAAIALYDGALKSTPDDSNLLYGRSLVYEKAKRIDLAEKDLRLAIAKDASDARALNALGYLLTPYNARLDEAAKLIARAREITPNDPAVLDSWGWVQVRQGKVREGLPHLQRAYELFPDAEVAAHLGEAWWLLGEREKARAVWDAASRDDAGHKVLRETMQRLLGSK